MDQNEYTDYEKSGNDYGSKRIYRLRMLRNMKIRNSFPNFETFKLLNFFLYA
jgi:hypothetical protein